MVGCSSAVGERHQNVTCYLITPQARPFGVFGTAPVKPILGSGLLVFTRTSGTLQDLIQTGTLTSCLSERLSTRTRVACRGISREHRIEWVCDLVWVWRDSRGSAAHELARGCLSDGI